MKIKYFLFLVAFTGIILFIPFSSAYSQITIKGKVTKDFSNESGLPFAHIYVDSSKQHFISDIDGNFEITIDSSVRLLHFTHYLFRGKDILIDSTLSQDSTLIVPLVKNKFFETDDTSSDTVIAVMKEVMSSKENNNLSQVKHLSFSTYNKATLTPENVDNANSQLEKVFKFLSLKFNDFKPQQHFIILESATEKKIYNRNFHTEEIKGAKSTILDVPSLFIQTTQIQSFSPYEDYINVGGKLFVSPLAPNTLKRYSFRLLDTLYINQDTLLVLKYNPLPKKQFDGLKGFLYINTKNYAVQYFVASPAKENKLRMTVLQSYNYYSEENLMIPERTKTIMAVEKSGESFIATLDNYVYDVNTQNFTPKKNFDEVILKYPHYANMQEDSFWIEKRRTPLTLYDSNTYVYYDSADQKKFIQRTLKFGEHLYYGFIQYKFLNLDLNRFLDFNQVEGARIGFGAHTNERLSKQFVLGGYFGYGFKDEENKYGIEATYNFRKIPASINTSFTHDLKEAGGVFFPFNRYQYSSENLRRIRMRVLDMVTEWESSIILHPVKYLDIKSSISLSRHEPTYEYAYKDQTQTHFDFTEIRTGFRYAYGEQFIQLLNRKISTGNTNFPIFYFQYTKGFNNFFPKGSGDVGSGDYNYERYDAKVEYSLEILDWGKTGIQILGGIVKGDAPYTKLYNMKGSSKNPSVVVHNSFETMHYNEFLSDRFLSFFLSHNFGKLYLQSKFFKPTLLLLHNFGFGNLSNRENHKRIPFKTMEKGYIESGMLLDDILIIKITGLKIGLGAGFFYRYGPYSIDGFENNIVAKFAINFSL